MLGIVSQRIVRWVKVLPCLIHWENGRCSLFLSMFTIAILTVSVYMCIAAWDRFPIHVSICIMPCRVVSIGKAAGTYDYCFNCLHFSFYEYAEYLNLLVPTSLEWVYYRCHLKSFQWWEGGKTFYLIKSCIFDPPTHSSGENCNSYRQCGASAVVH